METKKLFLKPALVMIAGLLTMMPLKMMATNTYNINVPADWALKAPGGSLTLSDGDVLNMAAAAGSPTVATTINIAANANVTINGNDVGINNLCIVENAGDAIEHTVTVNNLGIIAATGKSAYTQYKGTLVLTADCGFEGGSGAAAAIHCLGSGLTITSSTGSYLWVYGNNSNGISMTSPLTVSGNVSLFVCGDINHAGVESPNITVAAGAELDAYGYNNIGIYYGSAMTIENHGWLVSGSDFDVGIVVFGNLTIKNYSYLEVGGGSGKAAISVTGAEDIQMDVNATTTLTNNSSTAESHKFTMIPSNGYQWSLTNASVVAPGTLTSSPAIISIPAYTKGTIELATLPGAPSITTTSLPNGWVGTAYSQTLSATGDTPITWSVTGSLPAGLTLNANTGEISGNPTKAGTASFTVKASNGTLPDATQALSITIVAALGAPSITTASLPNGWVGTPYSQPLAASGNTPITWTVSVGNLPAGLTLNGTSGEISGNPTTAGTVNFTVKASNGVSPDATQALSITIDPKPVTSGAPTITTTSLPNGWVGTAYSQTLAASGNTPITWSIDDGFLPAGLTINPNTGKISGTPTSTGTSNFTVKASNGALPDAVKDFSITIYPAATVTGVTVSPATISVQKGKTQQFTATVSGTNSPAQTVKWSVSSQIDAGTAISSIGLLTVAAGETAASLTVTATSTMDNTKSGIATVTVINANTGIDAPQVDPLRAWTENGKLHLSGLTAGRQWSVYNIAGTLVHRAIAAGSEAETALPAHGIYIVRSNGKQLKIDN